MQMSNELYQKLMDLLLEKETDVNKKNEMIEKLKELLEIE